MSKRGRTVSPPSGLGVASLIVGEDGLIVFSWPITTRALPSDVALTPAERAVGQLALDGCTDAMIAAARGTSIRTVGKQLASLYQKLGVGSRRELSALCASLPDPR